MTNFAPTHEITLTDKLTHQRETIPVRLVDGAAYTRGEWLDGERADWTRDDDGSWWFQGRIAPDNRSTVSVRTCAAELTQATAAARR